MTDGDPAGGRRRRLAGRATAAVSAQGIQAATSLVLQVLAAHTLRPAGYGVYTLVLGILITMSALQAGLRDSAIVLEHHDSSVHGAILFTQYLAVVAASVVALAIGLISNLTSTAGSFLLAVMIGLWILEESGRRYLMASLRFWALVANDVVYCAGALGTIVTIHAVAGTLNLISFMTSMSVGSALSFAVAYLQLPRGTFRVGSFSRSGLRTVLSFAVWRSGNTVMRPLSITLTRVAVAGFVSTAALGRVEAARLLVAPAQVFVSGMGTFLLPHYTRNLPEGRQRVTRLLGLPTAVMGGAAAAVGVVAVTFAGPLQRVLAGKSYPVDRIATIGWCLFVVAFAATVPAGTLVVASRSSLPVFLYHLVDAAVGLASAVFIVALVGAAGAPYGLALGSTVGGLMLWAHAYRVPFSVASPEAPDEQMTTTLAPDVG